MEPSGERREPPPDCEEALLSRHRSDMGHLRGAKPPMPRSQSDVHWGRSNSATFGYASEKDVPPVSVIDLSALSQQSSYQLTSISKHYRRNQKLLTAFEQQVVEARPQGMPIAYLIGLIFVEVALFQIPKHGYYYSKRHKEERLQSSVDALRVTHQLEEILMVQQQEFQTSASLTENSTKDSETESRKKHLIRESFKLERLRNVANEQFECASHDRRNDNPPNNMRSNIASYVHSVLNACIAPNASASPANYNRNRSDSTVVNADTPLRGRGMSITESIMAFGSNISDGICPAGQKEEHVSEKASSIRQDPTPPTPTPDPAAMSSSSASNKHTEIVTAIPLSPSIETTLDTDQFVNVSVSENDTKFPPERSESLEEYQYLQQAIYDSGSELLFATSVDTSHELQEHQYSEPELKPSGSNVSSTSNGVSIELLAQCYHDDFDAMCENNRIDIRQTKTYQGKMPGSTNGCTIIAPLMCIHHFHHDNSIPDKGIPLETIEEVIDKETPSILPGIREKLGVSPNGFLIPSDAHESLMEQQYLGSEQFVTVCGGNILDDTHLAELVKALSEAKPKKLAATLFFHEHVISILQLRREEPLSEEEEKEGKEEDSKKHHSRVWFDIIDSLPHQSTFENFLRNAKEQSTRTVTTEKSTASLSSASNTPSSSPRRKKKTRKPIASLMGRMRSGTRLVTSKSSSAAQVLSSYDDDDDDPDILIPEHRPVEPFINSHDSVDGDELPQPNAMRLRCLDEASLVAALRWYACSVFSDTNREYINKYPWDENNADADPRIFQAFVWSEA